MVRRLVGQEGVLAKSIQAEELGAGQSMKEMALGGEASGETLPRRGATGV